jgi:hypothetical protein
MAIMKKLATLIFLVVFFQTLFAQAPSQFNYQAVARGAGGTVITGHIDIRLSLLEDDSLGVARYKETHTATTNAQGVFALKVGKGKIVSGNMDNIDWAQHPYWLQVEIKIPGASDYTTLGASQLLSVPYAMYAKSSGDQLSPGTGINIDNGVISNTGDLSDNNELQTLSVNGNQLNISNGNSVTLPTGTTYTEGAGIDINGNAISALDPSPTNEIQSLSLNGQQLSLSNGGGSVDLPAGNTSWANSGNITYNNPISNYVAIGANFSSFAKLNVIASGNDKGGSFTTSGSGEALVANCSSTGTGIHASSASGKGADFSSPIGTAGWFSSTSGSAGRFYSSSGTAGYFSSTTGKGLIVENGNVGIGTNVPDVKLDVFDGSIEVVGKNLPNYYQPAISAESYNTNNCFAGVANGNGTVAYFSGDGGKELLLFDRGIGGLGTGMEFEAYDLNARWNLYIDAAKDINFAYNNVLRAWIYDNDGSFHNSSDMRLKKDIKPFSHVLDGISKLQAYTYHMKDAPEDSPLSFGFMAQEVEKQFPDMVVEKDGYKSLCYDHFAVLSVQAIKEQQAEIDQQQVIISSQQQQLDAQAKELQAVKEEMVQMKVMLESVVGKK